MRTLLLQILWHFSYASTYSSSTGNNFGWFDLYLCNTWDGWTKVSIFGVRKWELMLFDFEEEWSFEEDDVVWVKVANLDSKGENFLKIVNLF
jgi:hypothetical protein